MRNLLTRRGLRVGAMALVCGALALLGLPHVAYQPISLPSALPIMAPAHLIAGSAAFAQTEPSNTGFPYVNGTLGYAALNAGFVDAYTNWYNSSAPAPFGGGSPVLPGWAWWNSSISGRMTLEWSADATGTHWAPFVTLNQSSLVYLLANGVTAATQSPASDSTTDLATDQFVQNALGAIGLSTTASITANYGYFAPNGSNGTPGFRAMVNADLPLGPNNTLKGVLGSSETDVSVPSCSSGSNALTWTSGTGFGCNSLAGGVSSVNGLTGTVLLPAYTPTPVTSSGTFTTPADSSTSTVYQYDEWAGGGGGGSAGSAGAAGGGGGGGGHCRGTFTGIAASTGVTITIGAAGTAGNPASTTTGGTGGNTTIGSPVSVTVDGGVGGNGTSGSTTSAQAGGAGGATSCSGAYLASAGGAGSGTAAGTQAPGGAGGGTFEFPGPGGIVAGSAGAGATPAGYGVGGAGAGATSGGQGQAGAPGIVLITRLSK